MKQFRKTLSILLTALMLLSCIPVFAFGANQISVKLRVEGIDKCFYYDDVAVTAGSTAYDVLVKADDESEALTVTAYVSEYGVYVSAINGLEAGTQTKKGWDGWQYHVNDADPGVGMDAYSVKENDSIVIFYGDEWGETGMYYPSVSVKEGKVSFPCVVTTYDENWTPVVKEENVTGYTLVWGYGNGKTKEFTPDEEGVCEIPAYYYTNGDHSVQIVKTAENGLPMVLRFAPDFTVAVEDADMGFFARFVAFFEMLFTAIKDFFAALSK